MKITLYNFSPFEQNNVSHSKWLKLHFCSYFVFFQMLELGTGSSEIEDKLLMVRRKCFNFPILVESLI
jgi:hypothetical protein